MLHCSEKVLMHHLIAHLGTSQSIFLKNTSRIWVLALNLCLFLRVFSGALDSTYQLNSWSMVWA